MTITEFLLARIAEDEAVALDAGGLRWNTSTAHPRIVDAVVDQNGWGIVPMDVISPPVAAVHIARQDPARVLAECEAKRRIVDLHPAANGDGACDLCGGRDADLLRGEWPCETLIALASVYADHPDYDPAWQVSTR